MRLDSININGLDARRWERGRILLLDGFLYIEIEECFANWLCLALVFMMLLAVSTASIFLPTGIQKQIHRGRRKGVIS